MLLHTLRRRAATTLGTLALFAVIPLAVADAARHDGGDDDEPRTVLRSALAGSLATDAALFGVLPGTSPWVIDRGTVRLEPDGDLRLRVRGLVIPDAPANGTNPVPTLSVSVFCGGTRVATTPTVPFDARGNARLETDIGTLPSPCATPAVLVHPNAVTSRYIAFNGSR